MFKERNKQSYKIKSIILLLTAISLSLSGCGTVTTELIPLSAYDYVKTEYDTAEVKKGDLTPEITLKLKTNDEDTINYSFDYELQDKVLNEGLIFDGLCVSVGDTVSAGTVLVSLTNKDLKDKLEGYEREKRENTALLQHYRNLAATDTGTDYSTYINETQKAIQVDDLYIQEINAKLRSYCIISQSDGVVTYIDEFLLGMEKGDIGETLFWIGSDMIVVSGMTDTFFAVSEDPDFFEIGKKYEANSGLGNYEMTLTEKDGGRLTFKTDTLLAASDVSNMTITAKKPTLKNVIYVNKDAVYKNGDGYIAYVKDENGYYDVRKVTLGETVGDNIVITDGLNEGEEAALNR